MQQPEAVGDIAHEEEERTEAHDGEDVGRIDNDGILRHREDSGDGVDSEDDVGKLDDQQHQEERRHQ